MEQKNEREILHAFLTKAFQEKNYVLDDQTFDLLYQAVSMQVRDPNESETTRTLSGEINSKGEITYESFKLFNLTQVKIYDLLDLIQKQAVMLLFEDNAHKVLYGLGALLFEFYPKMGRKFDGLDAEIIFTIKSMENKTNFSKEELLLCYKNHFPDKDISMSNIEDSLELLKESRVIRESKQDETKFELKEKIKNLVRV
jgi:hypothetical protein